MYGNGMSGGGGGQIFAQLVIRLTNQEPSNDPW